MRWTNRGVGNRVGVLVLLAGLATSCGDPDTSPSPGTAPTASKAAAADGAWSAVASWPFIPIHAAVLPDGRVLTYGSTPSGEQGGHLQYDIWDPAAGLGAASHLTLPNTTSVDTFCSAGLVMPQSGNFVTASGDWRGRPDGLGTNRNRDVLAFSYRDNGARKLDRSINHQRWYGTMTMMPSGDVLMQGGTCWQGDASVCDAGVVEATTPEIYRSGSGWQMLSGARSDRYYGAVNSRWWYPRSWVAPNGQVFGIAAGNYMYYLDTGGSGSIRDAGSLGFTNFGNNGSAVMYRPGKILLMGGGGTTNDGQSPDGRAGVRLIDINGANPVVSTAAALPVGRQWANATVLADGQVLVTGGSKTNNVAVDATRQAAIWNPDTGQWRMAASAALPRLYHSSAVLLPDGRVFSGGGGAPGPLTNLNAEVYSPPYLFAPDGSLASRPVISSAPTTINWGSGQFGVGMASSRTIRSVALIALGSNTHSFDMNQRYVPLAFSQNGAALAINRPASRNIVPPGYYMMFAVDSQGVPSVAHVLRIVDSATRNSPDREGQGTTVGGSGNESGGTPVASPPAPTTPAPAEPEAPAPAGGQCNQLANGSFVNGLTGWAVNGDAQLVSGSVPVLRIDGGSVGVDAGPVTSGQSYRLRGQYRADGNSGWAGFGIDYFNASGGKIDEATGSLVNHGSYTAFGLETVAPAGAVSARLWIYVDTARTVSVAQLDFGRAGCTSDPSAAPPDEPAGDDEVGGSPSAGDPIASPETGCNRLNNGGFEQGLAGWSVPTGAQLTTDAQSGSAALRFGGGAVGSTRMGASAGATYELALVARVAGSAGWAGVGIDFFDAAGVKRGQAVQDLGPTTRYQIARLTVVAPPGTAEMKLWVFAGAGVTISLDDIVLSPAGCDVVADVPPAPPPSEPADDSPVPPVAGNCNRLSNGSFETGLDGWASNTTLVPSSLAHSGQAAMELSGGWASTAVRDAGPGSFQISGFSRSVGSGWAGYGIDFLDAGGGEIGKISGEFPGSSAYGAFDTRGSAPPATRAARLWLFSAAGRRVTVDDLAVGVTDCR